MEVHVPAITLELFCFYCHAVVVSYHDISGTDKEGIL